MAVRITHTIREVIRKGDPQVRITHAMREILRDGIPKARITHAVREILRAAEAESSTINSSFFLVL